MNLVQPWWSSREINVCLGDLVRVALISLTHTHIQK
jgi:hypothetical protein